MLRVFAHVHCEVLADAADPARVPARTTKTFKLPAGSPGCGAACSLRAGLMLARRH